MYSPPLKVCPFVLSRTHSPCSVQINSTWCVFRTAIFFIRRRDRASLCTVQQCSYCKLQGINSFLGHFLCSFIFCGRFFVLGVGDGGGAIVILICVVTLTTVIYLPGITYYAGDQFPSVGGRGRPKTCLVPEADRRQLNPFFVFSFCELGLLPQCMVSGELSNL